MTHHIILGAGPAGVIAAETLRKHCPQDRITIVGDEKEAPYSRMAIPYLLIGNVEEKGTWLRKGEGIWARLTPQQPVSLGAWDQLRIAEPWAIVLTLEPAGRG